MNGGDLIARVLEREGVRFLFTLCGGHISPILVAAKRSGIRVIDCRHEATAVFAADAVARLTGTPGLVAVTAGPGLTNTITALKNAQLAESPLLLLGGATATVLKGRGALQDIDQMALLRPHVKRAWPVKRVRDLAPAVAEAFHVARSGIPGPVFVECPVDLLYDEAVVREWYGAKPGAAQAKSLAERATRFYLSRHLRRLFAGADHAELPPTRRVAALKPDAAAVASAAELLARAERPVLLVGSQALLTPGETGLLAQSLTTLGVPVYLSGMARGLLGPAHMLQLRHRRKEALREADLVILAGTPIDFRLDYGRHIGRRARLVTVNRSRAQLRRNRRPDLGVHAAPELFLRALAGSTGEAGGRLADWLGTLRERDAEREREIAEQAAAPAAGVNPLRLVRAIDAGLPDDSVIVADGGDFVATASYVVRPRGPLSWLDPGAFGTLGVGAGFALGAALARPGSEVLILYGDGSLGYSLIEMDTFARHGLPVIAIVGNDASWAQIARDQVHLLKDDVGTVLAPTAYHEAARGLGAEGFLLESDAEIETVLRQARAAAGRGRPVLVNARLARSEFRKGSLSM